ncbi:MAG: hypothetical protein ACW99U_16620 [Candidatus Thorarchaeota archaeon]|jgi:hypothetical protein
MSIEERIEKFNNEIQDFIRKWLVSDAAVTANALTDELLTLYSADLNDLTTKSRTIDDIVAIVQMDQLSPDIDVEDLWRKIRDLLEGQGLI